MTAKGRSIRTVAARMLVIVVVTMLVDLTWLVGESAGGAGKPEAPRHLIYLHGRIVQEQQSRRPEHPKFGPYELDRILEAFRKRSFVVSGEVRPKDATIGESADRVVAQVRGLLESGVPAGHVTVVGASMGAAVALEASARLRNPDVRFCLLGACLSESLRERRAEGGKLPSGRVLAVRERSDDTTASCPAWKEEASGGAPIRAREVVIGTGLGHGFLYRPLQDWMTPVAAWALAD